MSIFGFGLVALGLLIAWSGFRQALWIDVLKSLFQEPPPRPTPIPTRPGQRG